MVFLTGLCGPAFAGHHYFIDVDVDPEVVCVGCTAKVTITASQSGEQGEHSWDVNAIVSGACFVEDEAFDCDEPPDCLPSENDCFTMTCPSDGSLKKHCTRASQWFSLAPGTSKELWIVGTSPSYGTVNVVGIRLAANTTCEEHGYVDTLSGQGEFVVLDVDLDTDSDNDRHLNDEYEHLNGILDDDVEEDFPGRVLWPNADDDNRNGIADLLEHPVMAIPGIPGSQDENDLVEIRLLVYPAQYLDNATAHLQWSSEVEVWIDPWKQAPASSEWPIGTSASWPVEELPDQLWVEGKGVADTATLTLTSGPCSDTVKITVFKVTCMDWEVYLDNESLSGCPNNQGKRIFPDAKTYDDENVGRRKWVTAKATVQPVAENAPVYFREWDVDDPFDQNNPNWPEVVLVDYDTAGPDNRGSHQLVQGTALTDSSGFAVTQLAVSGRPGDNYSISATTTYDWHDNSMEQLWADLLMPDGGCVPAGNVCGGMVSEMLTVWRTLHLELDSMAAGVDNPVNNRNIDNTWNNTPHNGESGAEINNWNDALKGRFEGGVLTVAAGGVYEIIDHWDDAGDDTLYVIGNVTGDEDKSASFVDDDGEELPCLVDTSLMDDKYKPAYVDVAIEEGVTDLNANFVANLSGLGVSLFNVANPVRDRSTSSWYWMGQVLSSHQGPWQSDGDPNIWYHYHSSTNKEIGDSGVTTGGTIAPNDVAAPYDNTSSVFIEAIRDLAAQIAWLAPAGGWPYAVYTRGEIETLTVAHEVGHIFGCDDIEPLSGDPRDLMQQGPLDPETVFFGGCLDLIRGDWAVEEP